MIQKLDQLLEKKRKGHISEIDIKYYKLKRKFWGYKRCNGILDLSIKLYIMLDFKLRTAAKYFENIFGKTIKNIGNHK